MLTVGRRIQNRSDRLSRLGRSHSRPRASVPDASAPDASAPDASAPDASAPALVACQGLVLPMRAAALPNAVSVIA